MTSIIKTKFCATCGCEFKRNRKFGRAQWASATYCSMKCSGIARADKLAKSRPSLRDRWKSLFDKGEGCWEWKGTIEGYGYGVLVHAGKCYRAHVLALKFDGRPVPKGMLACHHCDNPRCVRPSHLYVGSAKDNATDAMDRGRLRVGERHPMRKLSIEQVRLIRSMPGTDTSIAAEFGISRPNARRIRNGTLWRSVQ